MNNYFSHDSNARNSEKLIKVRMALGAEGYGIYFMILERLREETNYMSVKDYNIIAFDLRVDASSVKKVVEDFGLFVFTEDGKYFYSESFLRRMEIKDEKSKKKSEAGKKGAAARWGNTKEKEDNNKDITDDTEKDSNAMAVPSKNIASKGKESKEKDKDIELQKDCNADLAFDDESTEIQLARFMISEILRVKPDSKVPKDDIKSLQSWAQHIDYMLRIDKRNAREVAELFRWAQDDSFWCPNIRSPRKLREKWDTLDLQKNSKKDDKEEKTSTKKTKFHNFDQKTDNYTEDELEAVAKRKRQEALDRLKAGG